MTSTALVLIVLLVVLIILLLFIVGAQYMTKSIESEIEDDEEEQFDVSKFTTAHTKHKIMPFEKVGSKKEKPQIKQPRIEAAKARTTDDSSLRYYDNKYPKDLWEGFVSDNTDLSKVDVPDGIHGKYIRTVPQNLFKKEIKLV